MPYPGGLGRPPEGLISIHTSQDCYCPCPCPCGRPLPTQVSTKEPQILTGRSGSVSCGVTAHFTWFLVHTRFYCALQESLFPLVLWNFCSQSCFPSKSDSLGIPSPFAGSQGKPHVGSRNFSTVRELLWYYFLQFVGQFDFNMITLSLPSFCGFFFVLGGGISFISGFQHPPVDDYSAASCDFGVSQEVSACPSTPPS